MTSATGQAVVIEQIGRSLTATKRVVEGLGPSDYARPTGCPGWTVRDVLNHTVGGMHIFAAGLQGEPPAREHEDDWLGEDPVAAYTEAARVDLTAWQEPDALERTVVIGLGPLPGPMAAVVHLTEVLTHGVDIAVATGQEEKADQQLCTELLDVMQAMGGVDGFRVPGVFGPEMPAPGDAPAHVRLLAYLGRVAPAVPSQR
jgi:uncharacterized protein (TIGR03086 family)